MPVPSPSAAGGEAFVSPSPANPRKGPPSYSSNMPPEVESGPQPAEFPEDKADSLEQWPVWKSALRFGAIIAGFYFVSVIVKYSQGGMGDAEFEGTLTISVPMFFIVGTALGFILVPLWRWQRWAPIALIILMFSGVLLYGGWVAGDISLGALSPPANLNEASEIAVAQPISTSTPVPTKTPWLTWTPRPTSTSSVGATLPYGTILGGPIEDYELRGNNDGVNIGNAYFGVSGHLGPKFAADVLANDRVAIDKAAQFFCDVAMLYGLGCDVMNELYEKLEENNNVGTKALGMTLVLSEYYYQCKSEGMMVVHVGILGNICPQRNNEYRIQWVLRVAD